MIVSIIKWKNGSSPKLPYKTILQSLLMNLNRKEINKNTVFGTWHGIENKCQCFNMFKDMFLRDNVSVTLRNTVFKN